MTWQTRLRLAFWHLEDNLRHSQLLRAARAGVHWACGRLTSAGEKRIRHMALAYGLAESRWIWQFLGREMRRMLTAELEPCWRGVVQTTPRYVNLLKRSTQLTRSVILKEPGPDGEKGVLLTYFEYNLARVLALSDAELKWLDAHYHLIFVASWSPTDYALVGSAVLRLKSPLFVQCANDAERARLGEFHPSVVCLPGLACDWVSPSFYQPKPIAERRIDILMVANWGAFKRHWEFFAALAGLPAGLCIVLVGQKEGGRDKEYILRLAKKMGVRQKLELFESLPIEKVTELECNSRLSIILSRREGGCVAAVESLFAGCALGMRTDARIGSAAHINASTGMLLRPGCMSQDLMILLEKANAVTSHEWACTHISNAITLNRVNEVIRHHALTRGQPWTRQLATPCWRPHPTLVESADRQRLQPAYAALHLRLPGLVGEHLLANSHH